MDLIRINEIVTKEKIKTYKEWNTENGYKAYDDVYTKDELMEMAYNDGLKEILDYVLDNDMIATIYDRNKLMRMRNKLRKGDKIC